MISGFLKAKHSIPGLPHDTATISVTSVFLLTCWAKKCIQLNLVAFGCIFCLFLPGSKFANTCCKLTFLPGQTRPKRFLPCQSFYRFGPVSFALVCSRVTKFVSPKRWKVGTKCLLLGKWWIECYVSNRPYMYFFFIDFRDCEIVFVTKGFYLVGFIFKCIRRTFNFSGTFSQKTVGQLYSED